MPSSLIIGFISYLWRLRNTLAHSAILTNHISGQSISFDRRESSIQPRSFLGRVIRLSFIFSRLIMGQCYSSSTCNGTALGSSFEFNSDACETFCTGNVRIRDPYVIFKKRRFN